MSDAGRTARGFIEAMLPWLEHTEAGAYHRMANKWRNWHHAATTSDAYRS
jgi:hypothetical protein